MRKHLLIIGYVWPEPKSSAAGSRMLQLIELFQLQEYKITFASPCIKKDNAYDLKAIAVDSISIDLNSSGFDIFVKELNPSIVLFDRFMMEEQFGWRIAEQCPNALRILDTEDLHFLRKGRKQALKENKPFNDGYLFSDMAKREIASIYRCDLTLIISEAEMDLLKNRFKIDESLLYYLPFMIDNVSSETMEKHFRFEERQHFITIGNFLHEPNYNAVLYLKETIWPVIRKQLPKAELHVYGAYASQKVNQLNNKKENFLIKGFTENANLVMQQAKVCLAPVRFGAGLKGKLVEAMQNGTPCITTNIGAEGMFGAFKPNGFISDSPQVMAEKAVLLYNDKALWLQKQKNGYQIIQERFNKEKIQENFLKMLVGVILQKEIRRQQNFIGQMLLHHTLQSTKYMSRWIEEKNKK